MLQAKLKLYDELLTKSNSQLTDTEIELMYLLSKDEQVQEYLRLMKPS